jgi:hypothetical protein
VEEKDVKALVRDPDEALRRWYQNFMTPAGEENVLTGGPSVPIDQIAEIFDLWFERRRDELRDALCDKLRDAELQADRPETLDTSTVSMIAKTLSSTRFAGQIDPIATAVVMMSRRLLDRLCGEN